MPVAFPGKLTKLRQAVGLTARSNMFWSCRTERNFGDWIGPYLFERVTQRQALFCKANRAGVRSVYFTTGSILHHIKVPNVAVVWGSGIISGDTRFSAPREITAVRGPITRQRCIDLGYDCPEVFGDPGILMPLHYRSSVRPGSWIGVVPHMVDHEIANELFRGVEDVKVINVCQDVEAFVDELCACEKIISSSLHGIILAHAYGLPAIRAIMSERIKGDGVKYEDYCASIAPSFTIPSVAIGGTEGVTAALDALKNASAAPDLSRLQDGLVAVCPFGRPR